MPVTSGRLDQNRQPYRPSSTPSSTHWRKTNPEADDNLSEVSEATVVTKQQPAHTSPQLQKAELSSSYQQRVGERQGWSSDLPLPLQRTAEEGYSKGVTTPTCSPETKAGTMETRNGWRASYSPISIRAAEPINMLHTCKQLQELRLQCEQCYLKVHRAIDLETAIQAAVIPHKTRMHCPSQNFSYAQDKPVISATISSNEAFGPVCFISTHIILNQVSR